MKTQIATHKKKIGREEDFPTALKVHFLLAWATVIKRLKSVHSAQQLVIRMEYCENSIIRESHRKINAQQLLTDFSDAGTLQCKGDF